MTSSRTRVAGRRGPARAVLLIVALAGTVPPGAARADGPAAEAVAFTSAGDPLGVGSVVATGIPSGESCVFDGGHFVVKGNTSVRTGTTPDCDLVIQAIERLDDPEALRGVPRGPVTPRQRRGDGDVSPSALPRTGAGLAIGDLAGLPGPPRLDYRRATAYHEVYDDADYAIFAAYDYLRYTRDKDTGALGPVEYETGYCYGEAYLWAYHPAFHRIDVPFRNEVTLCEAAIEQSTPSLIRFEADTGYLQTVPASVGGLTRMDRARFTLRNIFVAVPNTDGVDDDHFINCPIIEGEMPKTWYLDCGSREERVT